MIKALLECQLVYPYKRSIDTLASFCSLWDGCLMYGGTNKLKAEFNLPVVHFKKIFGENPKVKGYPVPSGMEFFIESIKVKQIKVD